MSAIVIEDYIPVPTDSHPTRKQLWDDWPLEQMRVGQSFLIPDSKGKDVRGPASAVGRWSSKHPGYAFVVRATPAGLRVWCLKSPHALPERRPKPPPPPKPEPNSTRARQVRGSRY